METRFLYSKNHFICSSGHEINIKNNYLSSLRCFLIQSRASLVSAFKNVALTLQKTTVNAVFIAEE